METRLLPKLSAVYGCAPCMEKLDNLGWTHGIAFHCYGTRIGIRVNDPSVLERIWPHLPPGWKALSPPIVDSLYSLYVPGEGGRPSVRHYNLLYAGSSRIARTTELSEAVETLELALHLNVVMGARDKIFLHAGVVGWQGRAIVLPGKSMTGKTTLVAELVRAGATYYSDEFAPFDGYGCVHPYARPLMIREDREGRQTRCPVEELGGQAGSEPLPVAVVAVTAFEAGVKWCPKTLTAGQGLLALIENTVLARIRPDAALKSLRPVALGATVLKGRRGEARDTIEQLFEATKV